jgi:DNA (cytosine-5)-methyltransferase 1
MMRVGDCFSGIGGFSLAAEWMGWSTAWFSEIDPFASRVLAHHWPDVRNLGDIRAIDWSAVERVDVLTAGFPCQPHSLAGKRLASLDERDLFDEIIRCAGVLRPGSIVLENVPGLFTSDGGRFFGRVLGALAALGYDASWRVLSAADVGAPHRRERVWIVAHARREPQREQIQEGASIALEWVTRVESGCGSERFSLANTGKAVADADVTRLEGRRQAWKDTRRHRADGHAGSCGVGGRGQWLTEPDVGRVAHGVPARVDRLRCLGNSIVPQCALEIFRAIEARNAMTERAA